MLPKSYINDLVKTLEYIRSSVQWYISVKYLMVHCTPHFAYPVNVLQSLKCLHVRLELSKT